MAQQQYLAEEDATVSLQSTGQGKAQILRTRVPTSILNAVQAQDGDAIHWAVDSQGYVIGYIVKGGAAAIVRQPPTPPTRTAKPAASKAAVKAPTKAVVKAPSRVAPAAVDDSFFGGDEDDDWGDDAIEAQPVRRVAATPRLAPKIAAPAAALPPKVLVQGRQPRVAGPILKPNQGGPGKRTGRIAKVGYDVPGVE